jgi:hypothetical protein
VVPPLFLVWVIVPVRKRRKGEKKKKIEKEEK